MQFGNRTEVLPLKKGQTNWLSAVVGEALKGRASSSALIFFGRAGMATISVPLSRISRPGDPGDFELLDLDVIEVLGLPATPYFPPPVRAAPPAPAIPNPPSLAPPPAP